MQKKMGNGIPVVAPIAPEEFTDLTIRTVFEPEKYARQKIDGLLGRPIMFPIFLTTALPSQRNTQRSGLSAVSNPSDGENIKDEDGNVNSAGETPEARARRIGVPFEPGLEAPYLDPVGMAVAPVGVAGAGAKVLATMASQPPQPSPQEQKVQIEAQKAQAKMQLDQQKAQTDAQRQAYKTQAKIALEKQTAEGKLALKAMEMRQEKELDQTRLMMGERGSGLTNIRGIGGM